MRVEKLVVGQLATNCYLVWDEKSTKAVIIDAGDDGDYIIRRIRDLNLSPVAILATHAHFDHVLAATELKLAFNIPFLIHPKDLFLYKKASQTAKFFQGLQADSVLPAEKFIKEGELINFGKEKLRVLETPGHTPGGISFYSPGFLFSGDVIFKEGRGRTDFSYCSPPKMEKSIKRLLSYPAETKIYPGHGEEFKVGKYQINW